MCVYVVAPHVIAVAALYYHILGPRKPTPPRTIIFNKQIEYVLQ